MVDLEITKTELMKKYTSDELTEEMKELELNFDENMTKPEKVDKILETLQQVKAVENLQDVQEKQLEQQSEAPDSNLVHKPPQHIGIPLDKVLNQMFPPPKPINTGNSPIAPISHIHRLTKKVEGDVVTIVDVLNVPNDVSPAKVVLITTVIANNKFNTTSTTLDEIKAVQNDKGTWHLADKNANTTLRGRRG